jgi:sortase A
MIKKEKIFNIQMKERAPLWKDLVNFFGLSLVIWGGIMIGMNYDAYAQIVNFKVQNLQASIFSTEKNKTKNSQIEIENKQEIMPTKLEINNSNEEIIQKGLKENIAINDSMQVIKNLVIYPPDNRIVIPRINKNVPLISVPNEKKWNKLEKIIQGGLQNGVVVHPVSHSPGNFGNFFVTGHSSYYNWDKGRFKDVFALLHEVKIGDSVEVYWEGKLYKYRIQKRKVVAPSEIGVLNQPRDHSEITLMTCTPVGTNTNRLILKGELIK